MFLLSLLVSAILEPRWAWLKVWKRNRLGPGDSLGRNDVAFFTFLKILTLTLWWTACHILLKNYFLLQHFLKPLKIIIVAIFNRRRFCYIHKVKLCLHEISCRLVIVHNPEMLQKNAATFFDLHLNEVVNCAKNDLGAKDNRKSIDAGWNCWNRNWLALKVVCHLTGIKHSVKELQLLRQ